MAKEKAGAKACLGLFACTRTEGYAFTLRNFGLGGGSGRPSARTGFGMSVAFGFGGGTGYGPVPSARIGFEISAAFGFGGGNGHEQSDSVCGGIVVIFGFGGGSGPGDWATAPTAKIISIADIASPQRTFFMLSLQCRLARKVSMIGPVG